MKLRTLFLAVALVAAAAAQAKVTEEETYTFNINDGGNLSVSNVNGSITVTGGNTDEIKVLAIKSADSQKALDNIEIKINQSADSVEIETDLSGSKRWFNFDGDDGQVTYEITVPVDIELDSIETVNGNVDISGVSGVVHAESVNGDLELDDLSGDVQMETVNGSISALFTVMGGEQRVKGSTVNGRMSIRLPADADVEINADTLNGSINARDFDLEPEKGFVGSNLNTDIGNGSARINLDTVNGSIKIDRNQELFAE